MTVSSKREASPIPREKGSVPNFSYIGYFEVNVGVASISLSTTSTALRLRQALAGIPTVMFGPGSNIRAAHRRDKSVPIKEIAVATEICYRHRRCPKDMLQVDDRRF